ncbi:MAG: helix-hairpin-helix domain-containing protein [Chloroflexota bacterium]
MAAIPPLGSNHRRTAHCVRGNTFCYPRPQAGAPEKTEKKAAVKKVVGGDDLTQIKGVGPTYAQRLKDAGLITYSDIANASADRLRDITRASGAAADPDSWINQARSLNGR